MRIAVGSDHRGFVIKGKIVALLKRLDHHVVDVGPETPESVDYPDIAEIVGSRVSEGSVDRGILICGTGMGMAITANKFPGVRAVTCHDDVTAEMSRRLFRIGNPPFHIVEAEVSDADLALFFRDPFRDGIGIGYYVNIELLDRIRFVREIPDVPVR